VLTVHERDRDREPVEVGHVDVVALGVHGVPLADHRGDVHVLPVARAGPVVVEDLHVVMSSK